MFRFVRNPDPRKKPPYGSRIDPTHPLAQGLVGCWLFNEGGGSKIANIISNKTDPLLETTEWVTIQDTGLHATADGDGVDLSSRILAGASEFTIWTRLFRPLLSRVGAIYSEVYPDNYWQVALFDTDYSGGIAFYTRDTSTGATGSRDNDISADVFPYSDFHGKEVSLFGVYSVSGNFKRIYRNSGELMAESTTSIDPITSVIGDCYFLRDNNPDSPDYYLLIGGIWQKSLDENLLKHLHAEPYSFILVPQYWYMVDLGAVGGGQTASFTSSLSLSSSQTSKAHYKALLTSSVGLAGAQTSLAHLLASLNDASSLQGQPSALRHRLGQLTSGADLQSQTSALARLQAALSSSLDLSTPVDMTAHLKGPLTTTLSLAGTFETVGAATALFTSVLTLGESLETKASLLTSISDTLSLGATPAALASLKASLTTTFNLSSEVASGIIASLQATLSLGASTTALAHFLADLSSALTMEGQSEVTIHYKINLTSSLSLSDQLVATAAYIMTLVDSLGLGSQVQDVTISATGLITIKLRGKSPGITITAGKPGIEVSGRVPETTFE